MSVAGVLTLRAVHDTTAVLVDGLEAASAGRDVVAEIEPDDSRPVIVANRGLVPRLSWPFYADRRWLLINENEPELYDDRLDRYFSRLADAGFHQVTFVSARWETDAVIVEAYYEPVEVVPLAPGSRTQLVHLTLH
jgi:hypothetical protein